MFLVHSTDWLKQTATFVKFKLFQNQHFQNHLAKNLEMCKDWSALCYCVQVCTRVTEELHSFLSQSELSNFFVYIITMIIWNNNNYNNIMVIHDAITLMLQLMITIYLHLMSWLKPKQQEWTTCKCSSIHLSYHRSSKGPGSFTTHNSSTCIIL